MAASVVVGPGQKGKHEMLQILSVELNRVEAKISSDSKLKKMAELQSTVVTDSKNKQAFVDQVISFFTFLTLYRGGMFSWWTFCARGLWN